MSSGLRGQRVVVGLYLIIVAFTGVAGYMTASVVGRINPPRFLFLIEFPPTPLGLAAFGALTIGLVLGILLVAVTVVSERFDDADPGTDNSSDTPTDEPSDTPADESPTPSTDEPPAVSEDDSTTADEPATASRTPTDSTDPTDPTEE